MKDRPIIFSGESVRAIWAGRKTQTRRVVKFKPLEAGLNLAASSLTVGDYCTAAPQHGKVLYSMGGGCWQQRTKPIHCRYGNPGGHLWVKETYRAFNDGDTFYQADFAQYGDDYVPVHADDEPEDWCWQSPMLMPRALSRLTLDIIKVRIERLHAISHEDVLAEAPPQNLPESWYKQNRAYSIGEAWRANFQLLWDSINAKRGFAWDSNPWVWVLEFRPTKIASQEPAA